MYLLGEQPSHCATLTNRLQTIPLQLVSGLQPCGPALDVEQSKHLENDLPRDQLFIIDSGVINGVIDERTLFYLQEGDLIGLQQGLDLPGGHYSCQEPVRLIPYQRSAVLKHIAAENERQELFLFYLLGQSTLFTEAIARLSQPDVPPPTGFKSFAAGEVLIQQGDPAEHVFIILEGHAEAWFNGEKVGDIAKDEIFGAMAVFTKERRSATVIASEHSSVMVIPQDQFLGLMQSNPHIAHCLIENMAHCIELLNKEVVRMRCQIKTDTAYDADKPLT
ncbi:MAG: cyclic nucleotide-binding domain-containing protein [Gammaproteobacteria bacterium]|nr:cyclic nucleotide-binding domain-containing protein [Gammaproteobacteria bacterium]